MTRKLEYDALARSGLELVVLVAAQPIAIAETVIKSRTFGRDTVKITSWIQIETTNILSQL